ncbi:unnamed protein product, partial [Ixodes hexagonus]
MTITVQCSNLLDPDCGRRLTTIEPRYITGGRLAKEGEFPWMVSLQLIEDKTHRCGGSLILPDVVLTAAHCLDSFENGLHVNKSPSADKYIAYHSQSRNVVVESAIHEDYGRGWKNDIALLTLSTPFDLERSQGRIGTVCLPKSVKPGKRITVSGWGRLSDNGRLPNLLRAVTLPVKRNSYCERKEELFQHHTMFCAGADKKDMC